MRNIYIKEEFVYRKSGNPMNGGYTTTPHFKKIMLKTIYQAYTKLVQNQYQKWSFLVSEWAHLVTAWSHPQKRMLKQHIPLLPKMRPKLVLRPERSRAVGTHFFACNYFDEKSGVKDSAARAYMYRLDNENNYFLDFGAKF